MVLGLGVLLGIEGWCDMELWILIVGGVGGVSGVCGFDGSKGG